MAHILNLLWLLGHLVVQLIQLLLIRKQIDENQMEFSTLTLDFETIISVYMSPVQKTLKMGGVAHCHFFQSRLYLFAGNFSEFEIENEWDADSIWGFDKQLDIRRLSMEDWFSDMRTACAMAFLNVWPGQSCILAYVHVFSSSHIYPHILLHNSKNYDWQYDINFSESMVCLNPCISKWEGCSK